MLTLINTNRMHPPVAPIGLEYVADAAIQAGLPVTILDLCLETDLTQALSQCFAQAPPQLVGLSFRNIDDCFWPSCQWFVDELRDIVKTIRTYTTAPIVAGGIGFSLFAQQLVQHSGVDYGIRGDGEEAIVDLYQALQQNTSLEQIPGLIWSDGSFYQCNAPAWPPNLTFQSQRRLIDNLTYFQRGGQIGFETKRGCHRGCTYCADPLAKGTKVRLRPPSIIADEIKSLVDQGINVLHTCDAEFNIPGDHAKAVCQAIIERGLGEQVRWYAYLSVVPVDGELIDLMKRAGCVGIDFTTDAVTPTMLATYGQPYTKADIAQAIQLCHEQGIVVMADMLIGGPGETEDTLVESIDFMKGTAADGIGCGLGIRVYPGTGIEKQIAQEGPWEENPNIFRKYSGPIDLFQPTFYINQNLGPNPARLVKDLINNDPRFFEPMEDNMGGGHADSKDHNYNANTELTDAIAAGERGAYWHIMLKQRGLGII